MTDKLDIKYILKRYGITVALFTLLFVVFIKKIDYITERYGLWGIVGVGVGFTLLSLLLEIISRKENKKEKADKYMEKTFSTLLDTILSEFKQSQQQIAEALNQLFDTIDVIGDTLALIKERLFQFDKDITLEIEHIYQKLEGQVPIEIYRFILQEYAFVISFRLIETFILKVYLILPQKIEPNVLATLLKTYRGDIEYILLDSLNDLQIRYFMNNKDAFEELQIVNRFHRVQDYLLHSITTDNLNSAVNKQQLLSKVINILKRATQQFGETKL